MWWVREFLNKNLAHRPKLFEFDNLNGMEFQGLFVKNSPSFHIVPKDSQNMYFHDMEIFVDVMGQLELNLLFNKDMPKNVSTPIDLVYALQATMDKVNHGHLELPIFPLNTDGIDADGRNITFRRVKITNFDDAIVAKPGNKGKRIPCTSDILIEDCEVVFGVGMSIGSIAPSTKHACVSDWTVRNVSFKYPFKAIYIKTNPGEGTGEINNILYENITIDTPIWWGIYIGP